MKKMWGLLATLSLMVSCSSGLLEDNQSTGAAAERLLNQPVSLIRANSTERAHYGISEISKEYVVRVQNLSPTKSVSVRQKLADGTWKDYALTYQGAADAGYETWSAFIGWNITQNAPKFADDFCFFMTANGSTYWDNNGGQNYKLSANGGDLLGPTLNVLLYSASGYKNYSTGNAVFTGTVLVRNLAPTKKVTIVYTLDGWKTTKTAQATYVASYFPSYGYQIFSPNAYGVERWDWSIDSGKTTTAIAYAISYDVNGSTYWDNNYGRNYMANQ